MAAAISLSSGPFHRVILNHQFGDGRKPRRDRTQLSFPCRSLRPVNGSSAGPSKEKEEEPKMGGGEAGEEKTALVKKALIEAQKMGDFMRPKQKGDWKDVLLMSFSFAVYVYISQKIVCAYCAWTAILNHNHL